MKTAQLANKAMVIQLRSLASTLTFMGNYYGGGLVRAAADVIEALSKEKFGENYDEK